MSGSASRHDAVIVGGGIVGLLTSLMLRRRGFDVALVAGKDLTKAASWGNAGYLAAGFGSPIPSAESISQILKWMISGESPVKVSASFFFREILPGGWLAEYLRESRKTTSLEYALKMRESCFEGVRLLKKIIEEYNLQVDLRADGVLEVYLSRRNLEKHLKLLEQNRELKVDFRFLDREECLNDDPLLSPSIVGGILFKDDLSLTPSKLMQSLRLLLSQRLNVPLIDEEVVKMNVDNRVVSSVSLSNGSSIAGRQYVVCAGVHTKRLLSTIGIEIPLAPAYGYMVMTEPVSERLRHATAGGEFRVAMSQTGEGNLRATGFFELSTAQHLPHDRRCSFLRQKATEYIPAFSKVSIVETWHGARPCTPTGLPVVGWTKYNNLVVAAGHCRLGVTTAAATAKLVSENLLSEKRPI
ncbi:MAG: FAD-binding oxidoreductase [Candidatus Caldarchaeum sp.]|nr:FAD-binding oxidoreductase [Candidatus Caldarchaeum sp.]